MVAKAIFLDKDGTLVEDIPYNVDPALIRLTEGTLQGLYTLQQAGYQLIVVSNQAGIAKGFFREAELLPVEGRLRQLLAQAGIVLSGFYYCPHHPQGCVPEYTLDCDCRKPRPGLLYRAARELHIDLQRSWMIGDILHDVEAGRRAGCRTILLDRGHETEWHLSPKCWPDFTVKNLSYAARIVLAVDRPVIATATVMH